MKVEIRPHSIPMCPCGNAATQKLSRQWVCDKCIAIDKLELGRKTHCGFQYVGVKGAGGMTNRYDDEGPIVGGSLKHLEAMLA